MIAKGSGGRRAWVLGAGLTAGVAVVALTGASPDVVRAHEAEAPAGRPLKAMELIEPEADFPSFDGNHPLKIAVLEV